MGKIIRIAMFIYGVTLIFSGMVLPGVCLCFMSVTTLK